MSIPRSRDLRLLAGAAGLSALGDFMAIFPLILHVQQRTGSAVAVSTLIFALWTWFGAVGLFVTAGGAALTSAADDKSPPPAGGTAPQTEAVPAAARDFARGGWRSWTASSWWSTPTGTVSSSCPSSFSLSPPPTISCSPVRPVDCPQGVSPLSVSPAAILLRTAQ